MAEGFDLGAALSRDLGGGGVPPAEPGAQPGPAAIVAPGATPQGEPGATSTPVGPQGFDLAGALTSDLRRNVDSLPTDHPAYSALTEPLPQPIAGPPDPLQGTPPTQDQLRRLYETGGKVGTATGAFEPKPLPPEDPRSIAAANGIEYDKPFQGDKAHTMASFAINKAEAMRVYAEHAPDHYGEKIGFRIGPQTGEIEYFNPDSNRWSLAKPPGSHGQDVGAGDVVRFGVENAMIPALPGIKRGVERVIARTVGEIPVMSAGMGIATAVGDALRMKVGQAYGVNKDVGDDEIAAEALKNGGVSAAGGAALGIGTKMVKFALDVSAGRVITPQLREALGVGWDDAKEMATQFQGAAAELAAKVKYSLGQITNSREVLDLERYMSRNREHISKFGEFKADQRAALKDLFDEINKPFSLEGKTAGDVGRDIQLAAKQPLDNRTYAVESAFNQEQRDLDQMVQSLSPRLRDTSELPGILRGVADEAHVRLNQWADQNAAALNRVMGNTPFIQGRETANFVGRLDREVVDGMFPSIQQPKRGLIGDRSVVEQVPASQMLDANGNPVQPATTREVLNKLYDPNSTYTFSEVWGALKDLKALSRAAGSGNATAPADVGVIKGLISALERDLSSANATNPAQQQVWTQFRNAYAGGARLLNEGAISQLMEREGGAGSRFVVKDRQAFDTMFANRESAEDVRMLINHDPQAMQAMREGLTQLYREQVGYDANNRIDLGAHKAFMDKYGGSMEVFFDHNQMRALRSGVTRAESMLQRYEGETKNIVRQFGETFEGKLLGRDPAEIMGFIADPRDPTKAAKVMQILQENGGAMGSGADMIRGLQSEYRKLMADAAAGTMKDGTRALDYAKLNDFLFGASENGGHAEVMANIFPHQYMRDLTSFNHYLEMAARQGDIAQEQPKLIWSILKAAVRTKVGLFTEAGRGLTMADDLRSRMANDRAVDAMLNPDRLRIMMQNAGLAPNSKRAAVVLGHMGLSHSFLAPPQGGPATD